MHPFFFEQLASQRREELQQEARQMRLATQARTSTSERKIPPTYVYQAQNNYNSILNLLPRTLLRLISGV